MAQSTTRGEDGAVAETPTFADLKLDERIVRATNDLGFESPTPIQAEAIPHLIEKRDIIGGARTGSGKTAAFGLPLVHHMRDGGRNVRALVLAPTRELARQVAAALDDFARHLPIKILTIYGGVAYKQQLRGLKTGVSVVVGTPGRVLDLIERGSLDMSHLEMLVLDEADEMLQMGFIEDIERVLDVSPDGRQIALFSATMPKAIQRVANRYLNNPADVHVESAALTASHVTQSYLKISHRQKTDALCRILMTVKRDATLVFARTKASVAQLAGDLANKGFSVEALHGDMNQSSRETVLRRLRAKKVEILVATDVAARGLDVDHISHVINYDLPENSETHVHRIGRTARAGREGWAITFVTSREMGKFRHFQRDLKEKIDRMSLPTDADIASHQRSKLVDELDAAMDASGSEHAEAWLAEVLDSTGWEAADVAAAALAMLALDRNFDLRTVAKSRRQSDSHSSPSASLPDFEEEGYAQLNEVELFFPAGRRDGLRPADFVGALCNEAGLQSNMIGRISLGGNKAFVGLPKKIAEHLLRERATLDIRNTTYPLKLSFNSQNSVDAANPSPVPTSPIKNEAMATLPSDPAPKATEATEESAEQESGDGEKKSRGNYNRKANGTRKSDKRGGFRRPKKKHRKGDKNKGKRKGHRGQKKD